MLPSGTFWSMRSFGRVTRSPFPKSAWRMGLKMSTSESMSDHCTLEALGCKRLESSEMAKNRQKWSPAGCRTSKSSKALNRSLLKSKLGKRSLIRTTRVHLYSASGKLIIMSRPLLVMAKFHEMTLETSTSIRWVLILEFFVIKICLGLHAANWHHLDSRCRARCLQSSLPKAEHRCC